MAEPVITQTQPLLEKEYAKEPAKQEVEEKQVKLFGGQIVLNPTITRVNFFSMIILSVYRSLVLMPVFMINSALLTYNYGLDMNAQKDLSSTNTLINLFVHLLITPHFGTICDKYGRKKMLVIGIIVESGCTIMMPNLPIGSGFYPAYFVLHTIQGLGGSSMGTPPLLADYIDFEFKGRVAALQSIIFNAGNYISQMIQSHSNMEEGLSLKFYIYGSLGMALGLLITLGLKGGMYHKLLYHDRKMEKAKKSLAPEYSKVFDDDDDLLVDKKQVDVKKRHISQEEILIIPDETDEEQAKNKASIGKGITKDTSKGISSEDKKDELPITPTVHPDASLNHPSLVIDSRNSLVESKGKSRRSSHVSERLKPGLVTGFKQAKNPWILIAFILGFVGSIKMGIKGIIFQTYIAAMLGKDNASKEAAGLHSYETLTGLICCLFIGFYADKANKMYLIFFALILSLVSTGLILLAPTVDSWMLISSMIVFGISNTAFMTVNSQLVSKYADPRYRASVGAAHGLIGTIAGNFMGLFGVWISKFYNRVPFYIYLGVGTVGLITLSFIYSAKRRFLNNI